MASNYPPGVTGGEHQISGGGDWERWVESVKVGDRVRVDGVDDGSVIRLRYIGDSVAVVDNGRTDFAVKVESLNPW